MVKLILFIGFIIGCFISLPLNTWYADKNPVVQDMKSYSTSRADGYLYLGVEGNKARDCGPPLAITGYYGDKQFINIDFLDDQQGKEFLKPDSQALGNNDFGIWRFSPSTDQKEILVHTFHNCDGTIVKSEFILNTKEQ